MTFTEFNLHSGILAEITGAGFSAPTPIQERAIPPVMAGRDVLGLAQTGTGKTAAFALPILNRLMGGARGHVRALILAPTRELAEQIHDAVCGLGKQTGLRSATIYGGVGLQPQIQKLRRGTEIVVACPGRLLDHIRQGTIDLSRLEFLVLDEADQMFDMGFLPDIKKILAHLPVKRQTLLFSATMPAAIRKLSHDLLIDPVTVQVDTVAPSSTVSHALYPVASHLKTGLLLQLLQSTDITSALVFTRTKHRAKRLGLQLEKAGFASASLQGNLSQNRRKEALDGFRQGRTQILVATDIAARGIDVSQVSHVVNFDIPDTVEAYIHRIGRTGRATRTGDAFTLVTTEDKTTVRAIEKVLGSPIERRNMDGFNYNEPASSQAPHESRAPRPKRAAAPGANASAGRRKPRDAGRASMAQRRVVKSS